MRQRQEALGHYQGSLRPLNNSFTDCPFKSAKQLGHLSFWATCSSTTEGNSGAATWLHIRPTSKCAVASDIKLRSPSTPAWTHLSLAKTWLLLPFAKVSWTRQASGAWRHRWESSVNSSFSWTVNTNFRKLVLSSFQSNILYNNNKKKRLSDHELGHL